MEGFQMCEKNTMKEDITESCERDKKGWKDIFFEDTVDTNCFKTRQSFSSNICCVKYVG